MKSFLIAMISLAGFCCGETREVKKVCLGKACDMVVVENGGVFFRDTSFNRSILLGQYAGEARDLIPRDEAPIKLLREPGITVVVSAWLGEFDTYGPRMRLRVFGRSETIETMYDGRNSLIALHAGDLFGTGHEILNIDTQGGHSYEVETSIFVSGSRGTRELLRVEGFVDHFQKSPSGPAGVWIKRETYDGVDANTKGWKLEVWAWDATMEALVRSTELRH